MQRHEGDVLGFRDLGSQTPDPMKPYTSRGFGLMRNAQCVGDCRRLCKWRLATQIAPGTAFRLHLTPCSRESWGHSQQRKPWQMEWHSCLLIQLISGSSERVVQLYKPALHRCSSTPKYQYSLETQAELTCRACFPIAHQF